MSKSLENLDNLSDEELMALYQSGNFEAFEVLYRRHSPKVFQYFKKRSSHETAADLLQEVFIKIHKARRQYSKQYPFLPWLFAVSKNVLIDFFKSPKNNSSFIDDKILNMADTNVTKESGLDTNFASAIKALPANQRRAIELRYLNEWTFEQIAKDVKTSPENVRQLVSRGLSKIRKNILKKDLS